MLELEEAVARILTLVPQAVPENLPLTEAADRFLVAGVASPVDLPLFDNSAMDGYAVRADDVRTATQEAPVQLRLIGKVAAGEVFGTDVTGGTCVRLFTGSPLPRGADAVVMQEDTSLDPERPGTVLVMDGAKPWENVRLRGEDIKAGATLAQSGDRLTAGRCNLLAAAGCAEVNVGRRPVVGLMATGSELTEAGQALAPGRIYESNRLALAALVKAAGGVPMLRPLVGDTLPATRQALRSALDQCDLVVSSGGVSVGELDFVKPAIEEIGGSLDFWKVAIRPGRPFVLGRSGAKLLFGLPGNPVSAFVTFLLLVRPALLRFQGAAEVQMPAHPGVLGEPINNPGGRRHFMRVRVDGSGRVGSAGVQESHALGSLAAANGLLDLPPRGSLPAGATVQVLRFA